MEGYGTCDICGLRFEGILDPLLEHRNRTQPPCGRKRHFNSVERYYVREPVSLREVCLQGPLEYCFARWCLRRNIRWTRPAVPLMYTRFSGRPNQKYYPDFYLPDCDTFIETKGKFLQKDVEKMNCILEQYPRYKFCMIRPFDFEALYQIQDQHDLHRTFGLMFKN